MSEIKNISLVIIFLGLTTLAIVVGAIVLALDEKSIPDALIGLGGTSLGALGAMLSKTSTGPQAVQVVNRAADPVPVDQFPEPDDIPTTGAPRQKGR